MPELVRLYDPLDSDRQDLDPYLALLEELGARSVLDVGCGTGTFALLMADRGFEVTGLDPAEASLAVARSKPGSERIRWFLGDAAAPLQTSVDAVTMTGNVAQLFITDDEWMSALRASHNVLRPGGHLIFETRDPVAEAWLGWHRDATQRTATVEGIGQVVCWEEVTVVDWPTVTFQTTFVLPGASVVTSTSTLRFRSREELFATLNQANFRTTEVREAPDRPGLELVFIAERLP